MCVPGVGGASPTRRARPTHMTEHSASCCLVILLRDILSLARGPLFLPVRLRSSSRSLALGKSWAIHFVSISRHKPAA